MPLPAALAARLAKRGLLKKKPEEEEEVFAESYDDQEEAVGHHRRGAPDATDPTDHRDDTRFMGYEGCPNKWNVYHECGLFCQREWGAGRPEAKLDPAYLRARSKMTAKSGPLPDGWVEKYDPGTGRHFYWCTRTDRVSWLPPGHPKAKVTEAASQVREMLQGQLHANADHEDDDDDNESDDDDQAMDLDSDMDSDEEEEAESEERRRREKEKRKEDQDSFKKPVGRARNQGADLDPMDPASYSDVERGGWSAGLTDESTRTGVDSTASGPLFQMRPYPSPGAILRANATKKK